MWNGKRIPFKPDPQWKPPRPPSTFAPSESDIVFLSPDKLQTKKKKAKEKDLEPSPEWKRRWIIAFPMHMDDHWTLGIAVNKKHSINLEDWHLFHFNSLVMNSAPRAIERVRTFAQFALGKIQDRAQISYHEIPVPRQKAGSNDCGLWPAHFLGIFLEDSERFIQYCCSVIYSISAIVSHADLPLKDLSGVDRASDTVRKLWRADEGDRLRPASRRIFQFYLNLYHTSNVQSK
jgi:hypothetical protein